MKEVYLVTGGAGFVGSNLVSSLLFDGQEVVVLDNLSRTGTEKNLAWLRDKFGEKFEFVRADVRDWESVRRVTAKADVIFHLASQVAVTTSVVDPRTDFEVNAMGTFNILEAVRLLGRRPIVVFPSTNKVYGGLDDVPVIEGETRYQFQNELLGINETQRLDFHSPYGCSKGAAEQYVRDYARVYNIPTVVFRMSCIYGPQQFGNEDQGWVAYFIIASVLGKPITIYGNGKQVRDILYVDDLIDAFRKAIEKIDSTAGQVYNIGGGCANTISIWQEFGPTLEHLVGHRVEVKNGPWRPGDQPIYVSDISKARQDFDWYPRIDKDEGISRLYGWVVSHRELVDAGGR